LKATPTRAGARCGRAGSMWRARFGGCVVLVGTVCLYAGSDEEMTAGRSHRLLDLAARDGAVITAADRDP
jgi:hypothetical protein